MTEWWPNNFPFFSSPKSRVSMPFGHDFTTLSKKGSRYSPPMPCNPFAIQDWNIRHGRWVWGGWCSGQTVHNKFGGQSLTVKLYRSTPKEWRLRFSRQSPVSMSQTSTSKIWNSVMSTQDPVWWTSLIDIHTLSPGKLSSQFSQGVGRGVLQTWNPCATLLVVRILPLQAMCLTRGQWWAKRKNQHAYRIVLYTHKEWALDEMDQFYIWKFQTCAEGQGEA